MLTTESEKQSWENLVSKRKHEIASEQTKIFGSATAVEKVPYSGRMRLRFTCPVVDCKFNNVNLAKHLRAKHQSSNQATRLQVN